MSTHTFQPNGAMTLHSVSMLQRDIQKLFTSMKKSDVFAFNLANITDCDSAGMALLVDVVAQLKKKSMSYQFEAMPETMRSLSVFYEVDKLFENEHIGVSE